MGYTHYWQQKKSFSKRAWKEVCGEVALIVSNVVDVQGVPLEVEITADYIDINGVGDDAHENLLIFRERPEKKPWAERGWDCTKTDRKPYDIAITAVKIYFASLYPAQFPTAGVTTDGTGWNWLAGLDVAKQALPKYGNQFDIPLGVREDDRWVYMPSFGINDSDYRPRACVNGKVYIYQTIRKMSVPMFAFTSVDEYIAWVKSEENALKCGYSSPTERPKNNARQNGAFKRLLMKRESASLDDIPVFVRPNCMVKFDPSLLTNAPASSFEEAI